MILFIISFILIFLSSYLITSLLVNKNDKIGLFYIPLIAFSQIVFDFELLSLFSAISKIGVLSLNILFTIFVFFIWYKKGFPLWSLSLKRFFKAIGIALLQDKYLFTLFCGFIVFFLVSVFLIGISPLVSEDGSAYHVARAVFWLCNKNLNHFIIGDIRNLVFPINSEILYAWVILFTEKMVFLGAFSFVGYLLSIFGIYNILDLLKFDMRRKLWVVFIVTSFSSVTILSSGTETDIIISGLILSSIYLFWRGVKDKSSLPLFISSLSYALAIGTKTTAFFSIPGVALGFCALACYYRKKDFYRPFCVFLGFSFINFILFASYNYVLNYINFGNISGPVNFIYLHKNIFGMRAIPAHLIKYLFLFIDFTGFKWADYVGDYILQLRDSVIAAINLSDVVDGIFTTKETVVNKSLLEPLVGMGVVGLLTFIPCLIISFCKSIISRVKKTYFISAFGILFLISVTVMSYLLIYMAYNIRFLVSLCLISAPILVYSYTRKNNPYKFLVVFFAMFSLVLVSTHIWARPFTRIVTYMRNGVSITYIRKFMTESMLMQKFPKDDYNPKKYPITYVPPVIADYLSSLDKSNKIIYFSSAAKGILPIVMLNLKGYHIDFELIANMDKIDLSQYNVLIIINDKQESFLIKSVNQRYCSYVGFYDKNNKYVLLNSECDLDSDFYSKNGFVLIDAFDKVDYNKRLLPNIVVEKEPDLDYYKIYENKNNPIKK